jgi:hypothetical protein
MLTDKWLLSDYLYLTKIFDNSKCVCANYDSQISVFVVTHHLVQSLFQVHNICIHYIMDLQCKIY